MAEKKKDFEFFPLGTAKYKATQQKLPERIQKGEPNTWYKIKPSEINDQLLQTIKGGSDAFIAEQRANYERDLKSTDPNVRPDPNLINFDLRNTDVDVEPITLNASGPNEGEGPAYFPYSRTVRGLDSELMKKTPWGKWEASQYPKEEGGEGFKRGLKMLTSSDAKIDELHENEYENEVNVELAKYNAREVDGKVIKGRNAGGVPVLGHELTHSYVRPSNDTFNDINKENAYITEYGVEYGQAATSGLNAMRNITGKKLNTPESVDKLFGEIEQKPEILENITQEHARLFRTYLYLKEQDPKAAAKLRQQVSKDSQYLVENDRDRDFLSSVEARMS
jgi:hypothetical protein